MMRMFRRKRKKKLAGGEVAAATVVAKNYLAHARVLAASFREYHPGIPFYVLLADEPDGLLDPAHEPFNTLQVGDIGLRDVAGFGPGYDRQQLITAAKPYLIGYLLEAGYEKALFLDADILVLSDILAPLRLSSGDRVILTPHLLAPLSGEDRIARELNILQSGCFNAGFLAISGGAQAHSFLSWWQERLREHCCPAVAGGMHYDQHWLDLAAVYFRCVEVTRHPGFNVAHWNLPERELRADSGFLTACGKPCCFFHFSGFDPDRPQAVTGYNERLTVEEIGPAAAGLFESYASLLKGAGYDQARDLPYRDPMAG